MKTWKTLAAAVLLGTAVICAGTDSPWGIAAHPHAAKEWENIDRQLGMMRDAGMTSLRHDMKFSRIAAKKGQYDFSSYDELLEKEIKRIPGLKPDEVRDFLKKLVPNYKAK